MPLTDLYPYYQPCVKRAPFNGVFDMVFSEEQPSAIPGGSSQQVIYFLATQGQTVFTNAAFIGALPGMWFKDGLVFTKVTAFGDPGAKEFIFDGTAGTVTFSIPSEAGEVVGGEFTPASADTYSAEPVTLSDAKNWLRINDDLGDGISSEDAIVSALITASRQQCEAVANKSFLPRTITCRMQVEVGSTYLPYGPVTAALTFPDDTAPTNGLVLCSGIYSYTAGYVSLPAKFKTAILMQLAYMYEHRGDEVMVSGLCAGARVICKSVRDYL